MSISTDIIDFPMPGIFASADRKVICWEGENYYRACGEVVKEKREGGNTTCVLPIAFRHVECRDHEGNDRMRDFDVRTPKQRDHSRLWNILRKTGLDEAEIFNTINAMVVDGFTFSREDESG